MFTGTLLGFTGYFSKDSQDKINIVHSNKKMRRKLFHNPKSCKLHTPSLPPDLTLKVGILERLNSISMSSVHFQDLLPMYEIIKKLKSMERNKISFQNHLVPNEWIQGKQIRMDEQVPSRSALF